jgi:aspartate/methionine/tyrosine aminotransferase
VPDFRRPAPLQAADRLQGINPFRVMTVLERAKALERQGRNIIHLEVGEPDFVTAEPLVEAGRAALASGHTAYTPAAGLPQLREAISGHYLARHGLQIPAHRIFVTPGASGALSLLAQMLLNPGDAVLMTDPGYPCNRNYVRLAGAEAILVPVTAEDNYQLTPQLLTQHATAACRSVWLASPSNPTGTVLDLPALQGIHAWCRTQGCHLLVDEIYHGLDYVGGLPSALQLGDDVLVVNSFSKYFGMTGWRLGWFVVPESLVGVSNILAQNLFIAASWPSTPPCVLSMSTLRRSSKRVVANSPRGVTFSPVCCANWAFACLSRHRGRSMCMRASRRSVMTANSSVASCWRTLAWQPRRAPTLASSKAGCMFVLLSRLA